MSEGNSVSIGGRLVAVFEDDANQCAGEEPEFVPVPGSSGIPQHELASSPGFEQFTLKSAKLDFDLDIIETERLFSSVAPIPISELLQNSLDAHVHLALANNTEKARSEWIIAPIMGEVHEQTNRSGSLFSGIDVSVDPTRRLAGTCDYLISANPEQYYLAAPIAIVVTVRREDILDGLGECVATMLAAALFNEREGNRTAYIYGVVTSGTTWKFLRLEGTKVLVDMDDYSLKEINKILAILVSLTKPKELATGLAASEAS